MVKGSNLFKIRSFTGIDVSSNKTDSSYVFHKKEKVLNVMQPKKLKKYD